MSLTQQDRGAAPHHHTPTSKTTRYQRLDPEERIVDPMEVLRNDSSERRKSGNATCRGDSVVGSPSSSIFRRTHNNVNSSQGSATAWTALSTSMDEEDNKERRSDEEDEGDGAANLSTAACSHPSLVSGLTSAQGSHEWLEDDDLEEDADMIRRYHVIQTRVPTLPAEFSGKEARGQTTGIGTAAWQGLADLRQGARQRRAARLLNPASKHDFLQTWFCDATDRGIALAAALTAGWLVVGLAASASAGYWCFGLFLFGLRVSTRTVYESIVHSQRRRNRRNSTVTGSPTSMGTELATTPAKGNPSYRDQQEDLTAPMV
jgi:hypothetical protein